MIPFIALICTDLRILFRTGYLWATLAIFAVLLFLALQVARLEFSGLADFVAAIILLDAVLAPVLVVGLMMLLERGEGSRAALFVSPLRPWTYLQARTITVSLVSSAQMLLLALIAYDGVFSIALLVAGLVSVASISSLSAFIVVAPFNALYSFMLPMIGWILLLGAPAYGVLMGWDPVWLAWHPTAPSLALLQNAFAGPSVAAVAYGVIGAAAWLAAMTFFALAALRRMQVNP